VGFPIVLIHRKILLLLLLLLPAIAAVSQPLRITVSQSNQPVEFDIDETDVLDSAGSGTLSGRDADFLVITTTDTGFFSATGGTPVTCLFNTGCAATSERTECRPVPM
jgi:hypothetical protein